MYDLSIILPTIRTHLLEDWYESASKACKDHPWELVITTPFSGAIPDKVKGQHNVKIGQSYDNPSVATQDAFLEATGNLIFLTCDDGYFMDDGLDVAIAAWKKLNDPSVIINMRYREGENYGGGQMPDAYWYPWSHPPLQLPGVKRSWFIAPQFMMKTEALINLGGFDCQYEYSNYGIHDMIFRAQAQGFKIYQSPKEILCADHIKGNTEGDHKPIYDAQTFIDLPIFQKIYSDPDAAFKRGNLDIMNHQKYRGVWTRRFDPNNLPKTYEEMLAQKNGKHN